MGRNNTSDIEKPKKCLFCCWAPCLGLGTRHATLCEGLYSYGQDLDKTRDSLRRVQTAIDALDGTIGFLLLSVVENYNYFVLADVCGSGGVIDP